MRNTRKLLIIKIYNFALILSKLLRYIKIISVEFQVTADDALTPYTSIKSSLIQLYKIEKYLDHNIFIHSYSYYLIHKLFTNNVYLIPKLDYETQYTLLIISVTLIFNQQK